MNGMLFQVIEIKGRLVVPSAASPPDFQESASLLSYMQQRSQCQRLFVGNTLESFCKLVFLYLCCDAPS